MIALNSRHPFSPFVGAASPCRTIQVVDAAPLESGGRGDRFRWLGTLAAREVPAPALLARFGIRELGTLEALAEELRTLRGLASDAVDVSVRTRVAGVVARLGDAVERYNGAAASDRKQIARELYALSREARRLEKSARSTGRGVARVQHEIDRLHHSIATRLAEREK